MNKSIIYAFFVVALVSFAPMLPFIVVVACFVAWIAIMGRIMIP